jgi:putative transcriptional regulator
MTFTPIEIDKNNLTIMGVPFPDIETLEDIAFGIGSNMYEGYKPTKKDIEIIKEFSLGNITIEQLIIAAEEKIYGKQ